MTRVLSMRRTDLPHTQRGVNLIEIMVAMVIGLFLVMGATTLYVSTRKTSDVDDSIARLQETARYAMSVIESDVRMANYWGMMKDGANFDNKDANTNVAAGANATALGASTSTNYCGDHYATDTENYLEATNNDYGIKNNGITQCTAGYAASASADTLTIRRAATATSTASANQLQVCSTHKGSSVIKSSTATCQNGEIHNLVTNGYYIDQQSDQGSTVPSLRRKTLGAGPSFADTEIIPGVEDMQIELGWDDGNGQSDSAGAVRYGSPSTLPAGGRIVAVRVWLLIRAEQADSTFTDTRTYSYADRTGTAVNNLNGSATGADGKKYAPNDNFRRLLVSRTFFIRNVTGT
jgi:type IV pilus assembly protein PilW